MIWRVGWPYTLPTAETSDRANDGPSPSSVVGAHPSFECDGAVQAHFPPPLQRHSAAEQ